MKNITRLFNTTYIPILLLIILIVFLVLSLSAVSNTMEKNIYHETLSMSKQINITTNNYFYKYISIFRGLAEIDFVRNQDSRKSSEFFKSMNREFPEFENVAGTDKEGSFFGSGLPYDSENPPNIAHLDFMIRAKENNNWAAMNPHIGPISGKKVTGLVFVLKTEEGEYNGIIGTSIKFESLSVLWDSVAAAEGSGMAAYDDEGIIHYTTGLEEFDFNATINNGLNAPQGEVVINGRKYIYTRSKSEITNINFLIVLPVTFSPWEIFFENNLLLFITFLLTAIIIIFIILKIKERKWLQQLAYSEEKYRTYIDYAPVGVFVADARGFYIEVNEKAALQTGYSQSKLLTMHIKDIIGPESTEKNLESFKQLQKVGYSHGEADFRHKDGHIFYMTIDAVKVNENRYIAFCIDITQRKNAQQKIQKNLEEKELLLKEVHHRVKNNLSLIYSILHFKKELTDQPFYKGMFQDLQSRVKSISIIHQRLYNAKSLDVINLKEYCENLLTELSFSYQAEERNITYTLDIPDIQLHIDIAIPCGLIITELVTNAFKYAFKGRQSGTVSLVFAEEDNNRGRLTICDDGVGLPQDSDISSSVSLGMFIIDSLSTQLKGTYLFESKEGVCFNLTFPFSKETSGEAA